MSKCYVCHKGTLKGHRVSHSNIKTRRFFKPNLHALKVQFNDNDKTIKKIKICSKCYKKIQADFWTGKKLAFIPLSLLNQKKIKDKTIITVKPTKNGKEKGAKS